MAEIGELDLSYRVARCERCGLAYADELASPETYATYYRDLSKYDAFSSAAAIPSAYRARARYARDLCAAHVAPEALIIDLGCGPGVLLDEFRTAGWRRVMGLDPAPRAAEQALELFGLDGVRSGTLAEAPSRLPLADAGLVCLTGVLEHLPRLREDMAMLTGVLPRQAKLLVEVPALEGFLAEPFEPFGEFSLEHLQYFCAATLARLFEGLGYEPIEIRRVVIGEGVTDSLFGLFARRASSKAVYGTGDIDVYVRRSSERFASALERIRTCPAQRIVVYGAGSHTARLLPALYERGEARRLVRLLDANPNLLGKRMGPLLIEAPEALAGEPKATVVISSFRSQEGIAGSLAHRFGNPLLRLY